MNEADFDMLDISIHALREEGDTDVWRFPITNIAISIHALREEGDVFNLENFFNGDDFYPRPPRGGRRSS